MSCAFMNYGNPFDTYADVIYYSGYQHWGGTQIATEYNTRYKPRMAIRKYS
jgi:hypothetical protein